MVDRTRSLDSSATLGASAEVTVAGDDATAPRVDLAEEVPARIGRYEIDGVLGRGAMGVVFAARDERLGRPVALKVVAVDSKAGRGTLYVARLRREAELLARLNHPNVVGVYDVDEQDGQLHIAMEFVEGQTLRAWMADHPVRDRRDALATLRLFVQAAQGLAAAHAAGVIHRDFKPDNVLVGADGRVRVVDFGVAAGPGADRPAPATPARTLEDADDPSSSLTRTGRLIGTPAYMAPEQFAGAPVGAAADQYALCVALFEAMFGRRPFEAASVGELALSVLEREPAIPTKGPAPRGLRPILRRGLAREPADRFVDMQSLVTALRTETRARRRRFAYGALVLAALGGAAVSQWLVETDAPCAGGDAKVERVWNPTRAQAIRDGFAATGKSYAPRSADRIVDETDEFVAQWSSAYRAACEATRVYSEQSEDVLDRRVACLDERLRRADLLLRSLEDADAATVERGVETIERLPGIADCARVDALLRLEPRPDDPERRAAIETVEDELDRLHLAYVRGDGSDVIDGVEAAVEAAEATGYRPTIVAAYRALAGVSQDVRDSRTVVDATRRGVTLAVEAGLDEEAARIALQIASHYLTIDDAPREALTWAELSLSFAERAGSTGGHRAQAMFTAAVAELELGDLEASVRRRDVVLDAYADEDRDSVAYARSRADVAGLVGSSGDWDRAQALMSEAIEGLEAILGPDHPDVAHDLMNLGTIELQRGRIDAATRNLERAHEILVQALGSDDLRVAQVLEVMAVVEGRRGATEEARERVGRAIEIRRRVLGPRHRSLPSVLLNHATMSNQLGDHAAAVADVEEAQAIYRDTLGEGDPQWPGAKVRMGYLLFGAGQRERGMRLTGEGIALVEADHPRRKVDDYRLMQHYCTILREAGDGAEAVRWGNRALRAAAELPSVAQRDLAQLEHQVALAHEVAGDRAQARALVEQAAARDFDDDTLRATLDEWLRGGASP